MCAHTRVRGEVLSVSNSRWDLLKSSSYTRGFLDINGSMQKIHKTFLHKYGLPTCKLSLRLTKH